MCHWQCERAVNLNLNAFFTCKLTRRTSSLASCIHCQCQWRSLAGSGCENLNLVCLLQVGPELAVTVVCLLQLEVELDLKLPLNLKLPFKLTACGVLSSASSSGVGPGTPCHPSESRVSASEPGRQLQVASGLPCTGSAFLYST